jgi:glycosyltransferase involved in cell wall biosynthesis
MKIVHLINHCDLANGNVHLAVDLACEQAKSGDTPIFITAGGYFEPLLERHGVRHVTIPHNVRRPFSCAVALAKVLWLSLRLRPDVFHAHMMSGAIIGFVVARLTGRPLVTTLHNSFDGHARVMRLGDAVVAVSRPEHERLLLDGYSPKTLNLVINGPLGSPRYTVGPERPITPSPPSIVSLCGLHHRKAVGDIIDGFALVARTFPDWRLTIAGEGPDLEPLKAKAKDLGVGDRVDFLGKITEPFQVLTLAEIFVIASHAEPFGLAVVEARRAGCAVIGTDVGGIPEVTAYGEAGILVPPKCPEAIAESLSRLMADPDLRADYQRRALRGLDAFTTERMRSAYGDIYAALERRRVAKGKRFANAAAPGLP